MNASKIFVEIYFSFCPNLQLKLQKTDLPQRKIFLRNLTETNDKHVTCIVFLLT